MSLFKSTLPQIYSVILDILFLVSVIHNSLDPLWLKNNHLPVIVKVFDPSPVVVSTPHSKIKVWDLQAALDPRAPAGTLCLRTLVVSVSYYTAAVQEAS